MWGKGFGFRQLVIAPCVEFILVGRTYEAAVWLVTCWPDAACRCHAPVRGPLSASSKTISITVFPRGAPVMYSLNTRSQAQIYSDNFAHNTDNSLTYHSRNSELAESARQLVDSVHQVSMAYYSACSTCTRHGKPRLLPPWFSPHAHEGQVAPLFSSLVRNRTSGRDFFAMPRSHNNNMQLLRPNAEAWKVSPCPFFVSGTYIRPHPNLQSFYGNL